ncbi:MAG: GDP-L-fucose synthase [Pelagibacteraceae bacterium]|jgi:GDP-L-fucose synthase|nr:GDP-L-fucose synthase [Pelagibacteraceae bacterium]
MSNLKKDDKIFIAGHTGMVGSAIERKYRQEGFKNILTFSSKDLDLRNQSAVDKFFKKLKPDFVILAAAKVGGIHANNKYKAEFIYDNIMIESNVIHFAYENNVKKLLFLGSSCIYPKHSPQPIKEEYIMSGDLEPTNKPYAIAKIAGIELCNSYREQYGCNFISAMPTNLYGTNDNYHFENSHVIPALLRKVVLAKKNNDPFVTVWGSGEPRRDFLNVDDLANACFLLMKEYDKPQPINIGSGIDISIKELINIIMEEIDYKGQVKFDISKPDGTMLKLLDISKIKSLGWTPKIKIREGIRKAIKEIKTFNWD